MCTLATVGACATSPTGRKQLMLYPTEDVDQLGVAAFAQLKRENPASRDPRATATVDCVAKHVVAAVREGEQPASWEVRVFDDDSPNAFALPGGKIGVHTGMLKVASNSSQLATVIGHEIAHVLARHANERLSTTAAAKTGLGLTSVFLGGSSTESNAILAALGVGTKVGVVLPFSRAQETEADVIGVRLMAAAGFDPRDSVELWRRMATAGGDNPPEFLSTHPSDESRIEKLAAEVPRVLPKYEQAIAEGRQATCEYGPFAAKTP